MEPVSSGISGHLSHGHKWTLMLFEYKHNMIFFFPPGEFKRVVESVSRHIKAVQVTRR